MDQRSERLYLAPGNRCGSDPRAVGSSKCGSHRLHLLLHQPINVLEELIVNGTVTSAAEPAMTSTEIRKKRDAAEIDYDGDHGVLSGR